MWTEPEQKLSIRAGDEAVSLPSSKVGASWTEGEKRLMENKEEDIPFANIYIYKE